MAVATNRINEQHESGEEKTTRICTPQKAMSKGWFKALRLTFISMEDLKNEKAKSGRYKDLDDLSQLEKQE